MHKHFCQPSNSVSFLFKRNVLATACLNKQFREHCWKTTCRDLTRKCLCAFLTSLIQEERPWAQNTHSKKLFGIIWIYEAQSNYLRLFLRPRHLLLKQIVSGVRAVSLCEGLWRKRKSSWSVSILTKTQAQDRPIVITLKFCSSHKKTDFRWMSC